MKFSLFYRQRWSWLYAPILLLAGIMILFVSTEWMPLPPRSVVIEAGEPTSNYEQLAITYRNALEKRGIAASIVTNRSWNELSVTLNDSRQPAHFGFAPGNYAKLSRPGIQTLASISREPLWIFSKRPASRDLSQLSGATVAIGPDTIPAANLAKLLFTHAGATDITWNHVSGPAAARLLIAGKVDAAFFVGAAQVPVIRDLLRTPGINFLGVDRAVSLTSLEPSLRAFALPQGAIELVGDIPTTDLSLVANLTHILVNSSMHPSLQRLLIDVATEIHERPTYLQLHAEFPSARDVDFKLSPVSDSYALGDKPFFEQVLPYWWAQLARLLLVAILPIVLVTGLVLALVPTLFDHQVNAMLEHFYGELKFLENDIPEASLGQPIAVAPLLQRLDDLERQAMNLELPNSFADRWYTLREHLLAARHRLLQSRGR